MINKVYLDSSFLVALFDDKHEFHTKTNLKNSDTFYISTLTLDETIMTLKKSGKSLKDINVAFLKLNPKVTKQTTSLNKNLQVLEIMQKFNLRPRDAFHVLTCLHNNIIHLATFDTDYSPVFAKKLLLKAT
jgi:predicted nucleic acid-binding protein